MPPVVTDLHVTDKDWQVSMLPVDSCLGRNVNRKWVSYEACFELSSLTFFSLEHKHKLSGSVLIFRVSSSALPWLLQGERCWVLSLQLTHAVCQRQCKFPEVSKIF